MNPWRSHSLREGQNTQTNWFSTKAAYVEQAEIFLCICEILAAIFDYSKIGLQFFS